MDDFASICAVSLCRIARRTEFFIIFAASESPRTHLGCSDNQQSRI